MAVVEPKMETVRKWIRKRFTSLDSEQEMTRYRLQGVLTPSTIPEFVIPGLDISSARNSDSGNSDEASNNPLRCSNKANFVMTANARNAPLSKSFHGTISTRTRRPSKPLVTSHSMPSAPIDVATRNNIPVVEDENLVADCNNRFETDQLLGSGVKNVHEEGLPALTLPHIRTHTSYGFPTVKEKPHTRRKESMYHGCPASLGSRQLSQTFSRGSSTNSLKRPFIPGVGLGGADVSPIGTPEGSPNFRRLYNRRRSSISKLTRQKESEICSLTDSTGSTTCSVSSDASPPIQTSPPATGGVFTLSAPAIDLRNISPASSLSLFPITGAPFYQQQTKEEAGRIAVLGELKLSIQYYTDRRTMKVRLIKGENLGKKRDSAASVNTFVKMCLMPSKQTLQSSTVYGTRDPVYQEQFEFSSLNKQDLATSTLRLRVYAKSGTAPSRLASGSSKSGGSSVGGGSIRRSTGGGGGGECLGEIMLPLGHLHLEQGEEVRMWRDLDEKSKYQMKGELSVSLCFEPSNEMLYVHVNDALNLPRTSVTGGLPETYVEISVSQPLRDAVTKTTKRHKSTVSPSFSEAFAFRVSPRVEDIHYTSIQVCVYAKLALRRRGSLIGRVVLGYDAREDMEKHHWRTALDAPGVKVTERHAILISFDEI